MFSLLLPFSISPHGLENLSPFPFETYSRERCEKHTVVSFFLNVLDGISLVREVKQGRLHTTNRQEKPGRQKARLGDCLSTNYMTRREIIIGKQTPKKCLGVLLLCLRNEDLSRSSRDLTSCHP